MMKNDDMQLHIRLPETVHKELKVKCIYEDISMQEYVTRLITDSLEAYSKNSPERDGATIS
jgi:predicted HicB family RNase H-like nuclease